MKRKQVNKYLPIYYKGLLYAIIALVSVFISVHDAKSANPFADGYGGSCSVSLTGSINCTTNNPYLSHALNIAGLGGSLNNYCPKNLSLGNSKGFQLMSRIIPCVRGYIQASGKKFVSEFYFLTIKPLINIILVFAVTIFGVLLVSQGFIEKLSRDGFVFVLKIAAVIWATSNLDGFMDVFLNMLDGLLDVVNNKIGLAGIGSINYGNFNPNDLKCTITNHMWVRLDCMIDIIIGINATGSLANGMLAFFFSSFVSGSIGVLIGLIGLYFTVNILLGILNAAYIYLMACMTIIFLMMIGGIIIPLIFFKNTFDYYRKWLNVLIATILQPILVFAFLNVVIIAFDVIIYSGDDSIMRTIAGNAVDNSNFNLNKYLETNGLIKKDGIGFNLDFKEVIFHSANQLTHPGMDGQFIANDQPNAKIDRGRSNTGIDTDPSDTQVHFPLKPIDWEKIAALRGMSKTDLLKAIAASFLSAGLASFVFISFLKYIPMLAVGLAGGSFQAPVLGGSNSASQGLRAGASRVVDNVGSKISNLVSGRR